jgi:hypothetical protein
MRDGAGKSENQIPNFSDRKLLISNHRGGKKFREICVPGSSLLQYQGPGEARFAPFRVIGRRGRVFQVFCIERGGFL